MNTSRSPVECAECGAALQHIPEDPTLRLPCPKCGSVKRAYNMQGDGGRLSNYSLDNFVSHKLSELTLCGAPELVEESKWLNTFILRTIFHFNLPPKTRAFLFNFLRRAEGASAAYRDARRFLIEHLATPSNTITPYFRALTQFEICISQCYQGYELLSRASGQDLYKPGDGSAEEKLQVAYVDSKHMDRMIAGDKLPPPATSGVWITNTGLESSRGHLPFHELHDLLAGMHALAEKLCTMQPPSGPPA